MKTISTFLGILCLMGILCLHSCTRTSTSSSPSPKTIVHNTDRSFMKACETGQGTCEPITLQRTSPNDLVQVTIPASGSHSTALLFDVINNNIFRTKGGEKAKALQTTIGYSEDPLMLEMTGLPDGQYHVHLLSCGLGGGFQVNLKTEKGNASMAKMSF